MVSQEGQIFAEKAPVNGRYIEMRDGYHPLTNDSYWQDEKREAPPVLLLFENVLGAHGSEMAEQDVKTLLTESVIITRMHKKHQVNRRWMRLVARFMDWLKTYGLYFFIMIVVVYIVSDAVFVGGV